jgi:hypothetical protein
MDEEKSKPLAEFSEKQRQQASKLGEIRTDFEVKRTQSARRVEIRDELPEHRGTFADRSTRHVSIHRSKDGESPSLLAQKRMTTLPLLLSLLQHGGQASDCCVREM